MKNTERDWARIAKISAEKVSIGFVSIGTGRETPTNLEKLFGANMVTVLGEKDNYRAGTQGETIYQTPVANWEKVTGLNYEEVIKGKTAKKSYYTKYSPHLKAFMLEILEGKTVKFDMESGSDGYLYYSHLDGHNAYVSDASRGNVFEPEYEEVTNAEFVVRISVLPDKKKEFAGKVVGVDVVITPDKLKIGCQDYTREQFNQIGRAVKIMREGVKIKFDGKPQMIVDSQNIRCEGVVFKLSDFDFVEGKLKELTK
jgi:hypothetical protein